MSVKLRGQILCGPEFGYLPDTKVNQFVVNFIFSDEGMGGFVNWTGATTYLAKNCPWVIGRIFCLKPMIPLLEDIHREWPAWEIYDVKKAHEVLEEGTQMYGSNYTIGPNHGHRQYLQPLGSHPFDVGFGWFLGTCPAPEGAELPILDYPASQLNPKIKKLRGKYVVIQAGGTTSIRTLTGEHLNPIIAYIKQKGLTAILLGNKDGLQNNGNAALPDDIDSMGGFDLRGQTSIKEAALLMQHSAFTLGLDGGLLHLAALMKDSRIVFGYNITSVLHRYPKRSHGKTVNVYLKNTMDGDKEDELMCSPCQSKWKHTANHAYSECYYDKGQIGWDEAKPERAKACMRMLFENDCERWKKAIDEVLCTAE